MPNNTPRILTLELYAHDLAQALTIPHHLTAVPGFTAETMTPRLRETDIFVGTTLKADWLTRPSPLRFIQGTGAGTEGFDLPALPLGCVVCNVFGHEYAMAEYTFMMMAALNRNLLVQDRDFRAGHWGDRQPRSELRGRSLLILGLGHIGAEMARWGHFMGMTVRGLTRTPSGRRAEALGLASIGALTELAAYLPGADFVVVALPHTTETDGYIGAAELRLMKPTAYLVNVGRGPVVDEAALYQALRDRVIAGAAIDVWYRYPAANERVLPSAYPFHELDNVIMTPHNSGYSDGTMRYRWQFISENIRRFVNGEPLDNVVWPRPV